MGVITSFTAESTMVLKAAPITTAVARAKLSKTYYLIKEKCPLTVGISSMLTINQYSFEGKLLPL